MRNHRFEDLGFKISIPEDWEQLKKGRLKRGKYPEVAFESPDGSEKIHILVGHLSAFEKEPTVEENKDFFEKYVERHNYTSASNGVINIGGKDHFWGEYHTGAGVVVRKYSIVIDRVEYVTTCTLGSAKGEYTDREIRKKERDYDEILSTMKMFNIQDASQLTRPKTKKIIKAAESEEEHLDTLVHRFRLVIVLLVLAVFNLLIWLGVMSTNPVWIWAVSVCLGSYLVYREGVGSGLSRALAAVIAVCFLGSFFTCVFIR